jgi:hypothetical protein
MRTATRKEGKIIIIYTNDPSDSAEKLGKDRVASSRFIMDCRMPIW